MRRALSFFLLLSVLLGCANTTEVTTRFSVDTPPSPANTLLLVADTPEEHVREIWELTCKDVFQQRALTILLSHQELPLWYEDGKNRMLRWAQNQGLQQILVMDLTQLLINAPAPPAAGNQLNPMASPDQQTPATWQMSLDGKAMPRDVDDTLREHDVEVFGANGTPIWTGIAVTHEANNLAVIAKSQCTALQRTLREQALIP